MDDKQDCSRFVVMFNRYKTQLYCHAVQAGFYSDMIKCRRIQSLKTLGSNLSRGEAFFFTAGDLLQIFYSPPPTLKKLIGHIAFGACVRGCMNHTFCNF